MPSITIAHVTGRSLLDEVAVVRYRDTGGANRQREVVTAALCGCSQGVGAVDAQAGVVALKGQRDRGRRSQIVNLDLRV